VSVAQSPRQLRGTYLAPGKAAVFDRLPLQAVRRGGRTPGPARAAAWPRLDAQGRSVHAGRPAAGAGRGACPPGTPEDAGGRGQAIVEG
jgi:hypothetical protein